MFCSRFLFENRSIERCKGIDMIYGIGNDIIELNRVIKACECKRFIERIFTDNEAELIKTDKKKAAGNFAVKEAVSKVFGTGFYMISPRDIEVLRDEKGRPYVNLYGGAKIAAAERGITNIHVTISNTKEYVSAVAVGECAARYGIRKL